MATLSYLGVHIWMSPIGLKMVTVRYFGAVNQDTQNTCNNALIIEIGWGWMGPRCLRWWSQWLFKCPETAYRGGNFPCRNASSVIQHNARSFVKLGFLNRHKRSVQSMVSAVQLLISAICMLLLNSSYSVLLTGFKTHADALISYGISEFNFQGLIKAKC
jgi:hypothetical protein